MSYEKMIVDGKVAVLVSPGYGAGWSTWNEQADAAMFDKDIVQAVLDGNRDKAAAIANEKYGSGTDYFYDGGAEQLVVRWVPVGTSFKIDEYDGSESLCIRDGIDWHTA